MPDDKEKVEDFISMWRKKMMNDPSKPSAIGDTLNRISEVEQENEELRSKIKENIQLFTKTEEIVKKTIEENKRLKEELNRSSSTDPNQTNKLQLEITELTNNVKSLTIRLTERDNIINLKDNEIAGLKLKLNDATSALELMEETKPEASQVLVEDLQSTISERNSKISELEQKIAILNQELTQLNEQLIGKETSSHVDYVIPVDTPKSEVDNPQSAQKSTKTLELLCQDLQADLNKYKRVIEKHPKQPLKLFPS
jgi:DNA repair exonuclease SbcCD ATPase subunit